MYQQLKWVMLDIIIVNNADSWKSISQNPRFSGKCSFSGMRLILLQTVSPETSHIFLKL